jgi:hypothetical protein
MINEYPRFSYILSLSKPLSIHNHIDFELTHFIEHNDIKTMVHTIILLKVKFGVLYYERTFLH